MIDIDVCPPKGYPVVQRPDGKWEFEQGRTYPPGFQSGVIHQTLREAVDMAWAFQNRHVAASEYRKAVKDVPFIEDLDAEDAREIIRRWRQGENVIYLNFLAFARAGHTG